MNPTEVRLERARFPEDKHHVAALFSAYAASLNVDLCFQDFDEEVASLPGKYAVEAGGMLLLARHVRHADDRGDLARANTFSDGPAVIEWDDLRGGCSPSSSFSTTTTIVGCVALRASPSRSTSRSTRPRTKWAEMKRLYVVPAARGMRIGEKLIDAILGEAQRLGYDGVRLDTLPTMHAAMALYRRYGFVEIAPYYETPVEGTKFLGLLWTGSEVNETEDDTC